MGLWKWTKKKWHEAKEFYQEHKRPINTILFGLGSAAVGGAIVYGASRHRTDDTDTDIRSLPEPNDIEQNELISMEEQEQQTGYDEYLTRNWREDMRENWDRVNALAETLNLRDGEEYYITGPNSYGNKTTIVSHLIDGDGVYPPDDDNKTKDEEA